ncbi:cdc42 effector protein 1 [Stigmatopora argus]
MNLQEKLSGLKGLVTPSHGKRRLKADLTADMISPPLGDFRHTMHVGRGGEVFGDTSFLSNHGGSANGETQSDGAPDGKLGAFFSRTLRQIRRGSDHRGRDVSKDTSFPPPAVSPIIKNAVSLPRLDVDVCNGTPVAKTLFPGSQSTPAERTSSYGLESGFVTLPRPSRFERQQPSVPPRDGSLSDSADWTARSSTVVTYDPESRAFSGSFASLEAFHLDLGPSLMSEVFGLLDAADVRDRDPTGSPRLGLDRGSERDSPQDGAGGTSPRGDDRDESGVDHLVAAGASDEPEPGNSAVRMESERFQSAADVLARHYGGGRDKTEAGRSRMVKKISYDFMDDDDEDEIKV